MQTKGPIGMKLTNRLLYSLLPMHSEKGTKNNTLMTKLYLGTALIYQDKILDGIYYLTNVKNQAAKDKNENLLDIVNSILGRIENALS